MPRSQISGLYANLISPKNDHKLYTLSESMNNLVTITGKPTNAMAIISTVSTAREKSMIERIIAIIGSYVSHVNPGL